MVEAQLSIDYQEIPTAEKPLLPERYPEQDLFICDVADAVLKDLMANMEHPFYSLSKQPDTEIRRYTHNGNWIEITPSVKGMATIYDKDILVYCISQIMAKIRKGEDISSPRIRINSRDLLVFTNRGTSGREYKALSEALDRLAGTRIRTNIKTGDEMQYENFGLIDKASIRRRNDTQDGRMLWCEITLSDWVFNAIKAGEVLTLNRNYFRLSKPLERRVYELARKHCGTTQKHWAISLDKLLNKTGSQSQLRRFKQMIQELVKYDHLPDYRVELDDNDIVHFYLRDETQNNYAGQPALLPAYPILKTVTYEKAKAVAPGYDIHYLEQQWREFWDDTGRPLIKEPDKAFIGFCKSRFERKPNP